MKLLQRNRPRPYRPKWPPQPPMPHPHEGLVDRAPGYDLPSFVMTWAFAILDHYDFPGEECPHENCPLDVDDLAVAVAAWFQASHSTIPLRERSLTFLTERVAIDKAEREQRAREFREQHPDWFCECGRYAGHSGDHNPPE